MQVSPVGLTFFGTIPETPVLFLSRECLQKSTFLGVLGEAGVCVCCETHGWGWAGWWGDVGLQQCLQDRPSAGTGVQCLQGCEQGITTADAGQIPV